MSTQRKNLVIDQRKIDAHKSTCHFYKSATVGKYNNVPFSVASGVFVEIKNNFFLFTAEHVVKNQRNDICIGDGTTVGYSLGGEWTDCEKNDVVILNLNKESVQIAQKQRRFLPCNEIQVNHDIVNTHQYTGIGFPASWNKISPYSANKNTNRYGVSDPLVYNDYHAPLAIYDALGYDIKKNIIIPYNKNNLRNLLTNQPISNGPAPYGMSGGGLWYIPPQSTCNHNTLGKKLVGILKIWSERKFWIATRIDVYTEIIRLKYNLDIEESNFVKYEVTFS
jgi:hypothetical protein